MLPVRVRVTLPLPGAGSEVLLKTALTPVGSPVTLNVTGALRPLSGTNVMPTVLEAVWLIERLASASVSCRAGTALICKAGLRVAVMPSPTAVIVMVEVETVAVVEAVSLRVAEAVPDCSVTVLLLHEAVTPEGRPLTPSVIAPAKLEFPVRVIA